MVANANCESCHSTLGGLPGGERRLSRLPRWQSQQRRVLHGLPHRPAPLWSDGSDVQRGDDGRSRAAPTWSMAARSATAMNFIHKVHVATVMTKTGYNYGGVLFDRRLFAGHSQLRQVPRLDRRVDRRDATATGRAVEDRSRTGSACGSCHDGINFDTGLGLTLADKAAGLTSSTGFFGKAHPDNATDGTCLNSSCHNPGAGGRSGPGSQAGHAAESRTHCTARSAAPMRNTNAGMDRLEPEPPAGRRDQGHVRHRQRVAVDAVPEPSGAMKFRLLQNGAREALQVLPPAAAIRPRVSRKSGHNFMGAPSVVLRVGSAAGRHHQAGGLQRLGLVVPAEPVERYRRFRNRNAPAVR